MTVGLLLPVAAALSQSAKIDEHPITVAVSGAPISEEAAKVIDAIGPGNGSARPEGFTVVRDGRTITVVPNDDPVLSCYTRRSRLWSRLDQDMVDNGGRGFVPTGGVGNDIRRILKDAAPNYRGLGRDKVPFAVEVDFRIVRDKTGDAYHWAPTPNVPDAAATVSDDEKEPLLPPLNIGMPLRGKRRFYSYIPDRGAEPARVAESMAAAMKSYDALVTEAKTTSAAAYRRLFQRLTEKCGVSDVWGACGDSVDLRNLPDSSRQRLVQCVYSHLSSLGFRDPAGAGEAIARGEKFSIRPQLLIQLRYTDAKGQTATAAYALGAPEPREGDRISP